MVAVSPTQIEHHGDSALCSKSIDMSHNTPTLLRYRIAVLYRATRLGTSEDSSELVLFCNQRPPSNRFLLDFEKGNILYVNEKNYAAVNESVALTIVSGFYRLRKNDANSNKYKYHY